MDTDLDEAVKAAPRHGLNAKALILQALQQDVEEDETDAAREEARRAAEEQRAADMEALRRGPDFLSALEPKLRPYVPFVLRPRPGQAPRVVRQKLLNKLAGEHLALAARRVGGLEPADLIANTVLWQAAVAAAVEQEAELCARCNGQQVYQNQAARMTALDWEGRQQQQQGGSAAAAAATAHTLPPAQRARTGAAAKPAERADTEGREARSQAQAPAAAAAATAAEDAAAEGGATVPASKPVPGKAAAAQLVEADLDWGAAAEEEEEEEEQEEGNQQQAAEKPAQQQGRPGTSPVPNAHQQQTQQQEALPRPGQRQAHSSTPEQQQQRPDSEAAGDKALPAPIDKALPAPKRVKLTAGALPSNAVTDVGAGCAVAVLPLVGGTAAVDFEAADFTLLDSIAPEAQPLPSRDSAAVQVAAAGRAAEAAAQPAAPQGVQPAQIPKEPQQQAVLHTASHTQQQQQQHDQQQQQRQQQLHGSPVEQEVRLFIQAELEPARRRGQLSAAELESVCSRATAKVMQRHASDRSADFLAREGPSISKLVAAYVEHVRKESRQQ